jgi:hypothetical protein
MRDQLGGDVVEDDLGRKWKKMADGPFSFLRATYWRWAETVLDVCPNLADGPPVLAVGDIHLENFGTWRDNDGRLVWGVNDFDEAADMPYVLDLIRLATSALLARPSHDASGKGICAAILEGYRTGLKAPRPFMLDKDHDWLRKLVIVPEKERAQFWQKVAALKPATKAPPDRYRQMIEAAMPEANVKIDKFSPRTAGTGSLGRPRWIGVADWRGGPVIREAKALLVSAWSRVHGGAQTLRCKEIASGAYHAPDRWYDVRDATAVRRLSPNSRKIEVKNQPEELLGEQMLVAMGHELANVHLGTGNAGPAIGRDIAKRKDGWLHDAADIAAKFVANEYKEWTTGK